MYLRNAFRIVDASILPCRLSETRLATTFSRKKKIKNLVRQLEHVKNQLVKEQTRQQEESDEFIKASIVSAVDFLNNEAKLLQKEIESLMKNDSDMSEQKKLLVSIPGIGNETGSRLIANFEMSRFESAKQVSAFVGLSPQQHQSGSSIRGKTKIFKTR